MSNEVFLSIENEKLILHCVRIVFLVSSILNIAALFCLFKKTPLHQESIKGYLLLIQATIIATDISLCIFFEPIPVLQAFAGYCVGLLCQYLSITVVVGIHGVFLCAMAASIILSSIHRHQTIVMKGKWLLSARARAILQWTLYVLFCGPSVVIIANPFDYEKSEWLIDNSVPDVRWIRDRGSYVMIERAPYAFALIFALTFILFVSCAVAVFVFVHMFIVLHGESGKSEQLKKAIRSSLIRLFIQMNVPVLFIFLPFTFFVVEILFDCFSFSACLVATCIIPFHPIVHNLLLILLVPEYRIVFVNMHPLCKRGTHTAPLK